MSAPLDRPEGEITWLDPPLAVEDEAAPHVLGDAVLQLHVERLRNTRREHASLTETPTRGLPQRGLFMLHRLLLRDYHTEY